MRHHSRLRHLYRGTAPHFWTTAFSFMLIGIYALIGLNLTFVSPFVEALKDFEMTDMCYRVMDEDESYAITIVDLTDLEKRRDIAVTLHEIEAMNPRAIVMDAVFEGLKEDSIGNEMLMDVAQTYDNIVFSCKIKEETLSGERFIGSFFVDSIPVRQGVSNMPRTLYGGVKRTVQHRWKCGDREIPSVVDEVLGILGEKPLQEKTTRINFTPTRFNVVQPGDVLLSHDLIEGRIVLFGCMAEDTDMHYTPLGRMAGVELLAYSLQTVMEAKGIWRLPWLLQLLLTVTLVVMTEWMRDCYLRMTNSSRNPIVHFFLGSYYVISVWIFLWIALLMWGVVICFSCWSLAVDIGWSVSAIAMLSMGRSLRDAINNFLQDKKQRKNTEQTT